MNIKFFFILLLSPLFFFMVQAEEVSKNGFILSSPLIPADEILHGGPPKDGIPAILTPHFIKASEASFLQDNDRILGVVIDNVARAYPIKILNWHELVNDTINNKAFVVSYCPLCGTGLVFSSVIGKDNLIFGVSGLLYNSDVLFFDKQTESLWSQILGQAVSGKYKGTLLTALPTQHTNWLAWKKSHPHTEVLSLETGHNRNYERDPYAGYEKARTIYFQVNNKAPDTYHPKEIVAGLKIGNFYKAYPFIELNKNNKTSFVETIQGKEYQFYWDSANQLLQIKNEKGEAIPFIQGYWFAWFAFYPKTLIYNA